MSQALSRVEGREHRVIRMIVVANFSLVGLCLVLDRVGGTMVDSGLRNIGLDNAVAWSLELWILGSTLLATGLFARATLRKSSVTTLEAGRKRGTSDGKLLLSWWLTLLALCAYGFMLGRQGF